ncbi:hypothetical protein HDU67_001508 [Dinochytrium kinnereticum]|nr:hypothetical protein HDU67_001508 [Dinochytrium kinnereticum]
MRSEKRKDGGPPFPKPVHTTVDSLVATLDSMCGGRGKGKRRSVRKASHHVPHMSSISITSYTCPENLYPKIPPVLPTLARGLFVRKCEASGGKVKGGGKFEIVARGYDKFFNVGETQWTTAENLEARTTGPYEVTLKENGCIIFVSAIGDTLLVTSKHSIGPHAEKGHEWLERHLKDSQSSKQELADFLSDSKVTAVFELADDEFEEHILEYPEGRRGLYLHGINENTPEFTTWPHSKLVDFAKRFGFFLVECLQFDTFNEVMNFTAECGQSGSYNGRAVEGFVIRCRSTEATTVFFKIKYAQPYLMYREWREVTKALLTNRGDKFKPRHELTKKYVEWAKNKIKTDRGLFDGYMKSKGIIKVRKLFLADYGLSESSKDLIDAAQETTEEFKRGEATLMEDGEVGDDRVESTAVSEKRSIDELGTAMSSLNLGRARPDKLPPVPEGSTTLQKIIIMPVGIVGLGKSTLGKGLAKLFPTIGHVQSDDYKKRFVEAVMAQLKVCNVVYADKCNHLGQHRRELTARFKSVYPEGLVVALEWDVCWVEQDRKAEIFKLATSRIKARGENHQTLTPATTPDYARVVNMFLKQFTALDPSKKDDSLIDAIVTIDPFSSICDRLKQVCTAINLKVPPDTTITNVLDLISTESKGKANEGPTKKKRKPPAYYGILIDKSYTVVELLDALFNRLRKEDQELCELWDLLKEKKRMKPGFHITLAMTKIKQHADLVMLYSNQIDSEGVGCGGIDESVVIVSESGKESLHRVSSWPGSGNRLARRLAIEVEEVVFDNCVMCIPVKVMPEGVRSMNLRPHLTIGTRSDTFPPVLSNALLDLAFTDPRNAREEGGPGVVEKTVGGVTVIQGRRFVRVKFGGAVELFGYVSEFHF